MQGSTLDDLAGFIRDRMEAATRDKAIYDRNHARLNGQLLQGELNMGGAVLAWIERRHAGDDVMTGEDDDPEAAGE